MKVDFLEIPRRFDPIGISPVAVAQLVVKRAEEGGPTPVTEAVVFGLSPERVFVVAEYPEGFLGVKRIRDLISGLRESLHAMDAGLGAYAREVARIAAENGFSRTLIVYRDDYREWAVVFYNTL